MTSLTLVFRACDLLSLLRPMLPSVGGFAILSDGYFFVDFGFCYIIAQFICNGLNRMGILLKLYCYFVLFALLFSFFSGIFDE